MAENIWLYEIIEELRKLGGQAKLLDIYNEIEERNQIPFSDFVDWKAQVRKNRNLHSSEYDIFRGKAGDSTDLFFATSGKGTGLISADNYRVTVYKG